MEPHSRDLAPPLSLAPDPRNKCAISAGCANGVSHSSRLRGTTLSRRSETGSTRAPSRPNSVRDFRDLRNYGPRGATYRDHSGAANSRMKGTFLC